MSKKLYPKFHSKAIKWTKKNVTHEWFGSKNAERLVDSVEFGALATGSGLIVKGTVNLVGKGVKKVADLAKDGFTSIKDKATKIIPFKQQKKVANP